MIDVKFGFLVGCPTAHTPSSVINQYLITKFQPLTRLVEVWCFWGWYGVLLLNEHQAVRKPLISDLVLVADSFLGFVPEWGFSKVFVKFRITRLATSKIGSLCFAPTNQFVA